MIEVEYRIEFSHLQDLANADLTPAFARMSSYFMSEMLQMFDSAGSSRGHTWPPLKPETVEWKLKHGYSASSLIRSGLMRASLRQLELNGERLVFGSDVSYSKYHQKGGRDLPRRALIVPLQRDADELAGHVRDALLDTAQGGRAS